MREILARMVLAAGFLTAAWHFWFTPPELIGVRVVHLQKEPRARRAAAERTLPVNPALSSAWAAEIAEALQGRGPLAARRQRSFIYFAAGEAPVRAVAPALRASLQRTGFVNAFTSAGAYHLEFMLYREPHSAGAPAGVMFPLRSRAFTFVLAAVVLYGLLSVGGPTGARYDPAPLIALDGVAAACAGFFFGLPLWVYPSTQAALDDWTGGTLWSWLVSAAMLMCLLALARRAAYRIAVTPQGVVIRKLLASTLIPWDRITQATVKDERGVAAGIELRLSGKERAFLPWTAMMDFLPVVQAINGRVAIRA